MPVIRTPFDKCWREYLDLPAIDDDPFRFHTIADLLFAAQFEVDLYEEGDSGCAISAKDADKIKSFIRKWTKTDTAREASN